MVNQVQNNSTLTVGLTTKILPPQWVLDWRVSKNYFPHGRSILMAVINAL
jgi:hypothetical protein